MTASVLVVTMGTDAVAPARMPRELKRAGFDVTLLTPRDSLAAHTAFADRIGHFPEGVRLHQWVQTLIEAAGEWAPLLGSRSFESYQNKVHLALNPQPEKPERTKPAGKAADGEAAR